MVVAASVVSMLAVLSGACVDDPEPSPAPAPPEPQAWTALCTSEAVAADPDRCVDDGPGQCPPSEDDTPVAPLARCETCGCPGALACVPTDDGATCASARVREAVRGPDVGQTGIAPDLDDAAYFALVDAVLDVERPDTVAQLKATLQSLANDDSRRSLILLGHEDGDDVAALQQALGAPDVVDAASCADIEAAVGAAGIATAGDADLQVLPGAVDDVHDALCAFPGAVPSCALPHRAACLARGGGIASVVVFVDDAIFYPRLDLALLGTLARINRSQWEQRLDELVDQATSHQLGIASSPAHRVDDGEEIRVVRRPDGDDGAAVFFAWRPAPSLRPRGLKAFRVLWKDGIHQQFLTTHDLTPQECVLRGSVTADDAAVGVACVASDGARLEATVDADRGTILESVRQEP